LLAGKNLIARNHIAGKAVKREEIFFKNKKNLRVEKKSNTSLYLSGLLNWVDQVLYSLS